MANEPVVELWQLHCLSRCGRDLVAQRDFADGGVSKERDEWIRAQMKRWCSLYPTLSLGGASWEMVREDHQTFFLAAVDEGEIV